MGDAALPSEAELERAVKESSLPALDTDRISVVRRACIRQGSFPKEVVTLSVAGRTLEVFCKYECGFDHSAHGHRGGVTYEARVYLEVLGPGGYSTPEVVVVYCPSDRTDTWLLLEFLPNAMRVSKSTDPGAMPAAAEWIGRFHRSTSEADVPEFVRRYDRDYYLGWVERTNARVARHGQAGEWWSRVLRRFEQHLDLLVNPGQSLLHGEYYPKNVLWTSERVSPVDWESTAIGPGSIDLACLVDEWPRDVVQRCLQAYVWGRWSEDSVPGWFEEQRRLAELYLQFRWLGEQTDDMSRPLSRHARGRVLRIRWLGEQLGWL